ncbi:protein kinase [Strigomonas culicis]|uniref:Protein kinase n=1 Tax=Strigomonas culicis TaxID=28005 RepID=S9US88_9TRYP|nr:protein kinase [Strigomonas culicis]EPY31967.1 protein kinase [Strigomonas culicis]EPY33822.1 protein kinase [Strigomonas culicis]|eukprot:EPY20330.1 protein kinase [Strigomonas culicis]
MPQPIPLKIITAENNVVSCIGDPSDMWEVQGSDHLAPAFEHGAGLTLADFKQEIRQSVEMVATEPYEKEPPPSDLPIDSFPLRIIFDKGKTGFETEKEFPIEKGTLIAGRYRIEEFIDSATFSRTASCFDEKNEENVCIKIIRNAKDYFDQSLDELKLLQEINRAGSPDENSILRLIDYFYYKEHMFIVTELLADNLYQFSKFNSEQEADFYFTLPRLQSIAKQILTALKLVHSLRIIHCDLKPENILFKSYRRCLVKVIDFGSSCYFTDNLSSYVQSRSYRAPEVILGCKYNDRVDIWSVGAILAEMATGRVLFNADTVPAILALMAAVCGPVTSRVLHEGRNTPFFVTKHGAFYEYREESLVFHFPESPITEYGEFLGYNDDEYVDFIRQCLRLDPEERPSAETLLRHPFITKNYDTNSPVRTKE